ncbi:squalene/phytoene synthase family protein [Candidatus Mesenet endosymbiont of Agriotes lineatus]|uniref:squalene/phytoene synthase family protein n=1 Tax=Candidatus Mesenet endosymbiont of Agriotes lineatus TaxID=3077948 RepID=UPI0030D1E79D
MHNSTIDSYCVDYVRQNDRDRFVCALFSKGDIRYYFLVLSAFNIEISNILYSSTEIMTALVLIKWWRERIKMIYNNKLTNADKITKELETVIKSTNIPETLFHQYLDGYEEAICRDEYLNTEELEDNAVKTTVHLMKMIFATADIKDRDDDLNQIIYHSGIAWNLMNNLRNERYLNSKGRTLLPKDLLKSAGIENAPSFKNNLALKEVVEHMVEVTQNHIDKVKMLIRNIPREIISIALMPILAEFYLKRICRRKFDIINKEVGTISPIMQIKLLLYKIKICCS